MILLGVDLMKQERLIKMLENAKNKLLKATKSLDKLNQKLIQKQQENDFTEILESDIRRKEREISDIKKSILEYEEKLKGVAQNEN